MEWHGKALVAGNSEMTPSLTLLIPAYNASATIARAVRSALAEKEVAEVIVVDDASTDNTVEVARAADDGSGRLKVLVQPGNMGPSAARNRALAESALPSETAWVGILDADDYFVAGRIAAMLAHTDAADMIADNMLREVAGREMEGRQKLLDNTTFTAPRTIDFTTFVASNVTRRGRNRGELGFIKPLMRRSFLEAHNIHYREDMRLGEDYELYARALAHGARLLLLPEAGYVSVVRANSLSGQHSEHDLQVLRDCDEDLARIEGLCAADHAALRAHYRSVDCRLQWRLLINAVKARDVRAAAACFARPYPVPFYLIRELWGQLVLRSARAVKGIGR
ncbi:MAG TPA: glycosyl transferase family A [Rhodospirillaceae bacterium]|nr:glycosyl transferase family A [Rhodospirillaceae bacterium]